MKIVLLNTKDGLLLKKVGHYTRQLNEAMSFQTTSLAAEFRSSNNLNDHTVAAKFSDAGPDVRLCYSGG
jgi:hypothetical protein